MDRIRELIGVLSDDTVRFREKTAKAIHCCKICGNIVKSFKSPRYELEYSISSICQSCQDYYWGSTVRLHD